MENLSYDSKSYAMKNGYIKYRKLLHPQTAHCPQDTKVYENFYITNKKPDDAPLCLTVKEMYLLLTKLEIFQREAIKKQMSIDALPRPSDDIDGPWPPEIYTQRILFLLDSSNIQFARAFIWTIGRRVKLTLEAHCCSYELATKLRPDSGVIEIDLGENLELIKKFVDECVSL